MKTKTGIVMDIKNNKITLMTDSGEFVHVKRNKSLLEMGSIYTGEIYTKLPLRKLIATAAVFLFFIFGSVEAYAYYTPTSTFVLGGVAEIEIKTNKWDKIISVNGLNNEGKAIIKETSVKHNSINNGLQKILETTKKSFENEDTSEDLTLTIKDSNNHNNEKNLKSKIDSANLPINIEIVNSNIEKNKQNENLNNNNNNNNNQKSEKLNGKPNIHDESDKNNIKNPTKDTDFKNNAKNKDSNESKNNSKSHPNENSNYNKNKNKNDNSNKNNNGNSHKNNNDIKNNTNGKKSDKSKK
ncbi:hypothetical protein SH2C18_47610 [Clostridium sediminicola]|uniref:anti-sigma factor domain-containing protein n=1 Tax=Clostridium sediminicola TaxID=3114879 RepID=UPI0031F206A5